MGNYFSIQHPKCNYNCPNCKNSGKIPNIAGRFFLITPTQCQCNACHSIFDKSYYYKSIVNHPELYNEHEIVEATEVYVLS